MAMIELVPIRLKVAERLKEAMKEDLILASTSAEDFDLESSRSLVVECIRKSVSHVMDEVTPHLRCRKSSSEIMTIVAEVVDGSVSYAERSLGWDSSVYHTVMHLANGASAARLAEGEFGAKRYLDGDNTRLVLEGVSGIIGNVAHLTWMERADGYVR